MLTIVELFVLLIAFGLVLYGMVKNSALFVGGAVVAIIFDLALILLVHSK